jgi:hypothetical protein
VVSVKAEERTDDALRTAHLLRIAMIGMAEASLRGSGPGGKDDETLAKLHDLVREGRAYLAGGETAVALGRMRVAQDILTLHIIRLSDG